jgi:hypothetical protein
MAINDVYQVVAAFTNGASGKTMSFTTSIRQKGVAMPSVATVAGNYVDWWDTGLGGGAAYKTYCPDETALTEVTLRRVRPLEPLIQSFTTGLPIAGTNATDPYAPSIAVLATLRTANIGRSYRGRMYLPGVAEDKVGSNATLSAADAEDIAEGITGLFAALDADDVAVCIWSRTLDISTDVSNIYIDRVLRTQRRRQDRTPVYVAP